MKEVQYYTVLYTHKHTQSTHTHAHTHTNKTRPCLATVSQCPAADCSFVLNLRIISNLVIRVCYQDNRIGPASSVPKPVRTSTVVARRKNEPIDLNMGSEFLTESLLLQMTCCFTGTQVRYYRLWWSVMSLSIGEHFSILTVARCTLLFFFLPLILCEKAKAVNSQLR